MNYDCENCKLTDILCNGESALISGRLAVIPVTKMISFNFPRFEDSQACVYMGFFKDDGKIYQKILGVIDKVTIPYLKVIDSPKEGQQFQHEIPYNCENCIVDRIFCDGIQLDAISTRRKANNIGSLGFYSVTPTEITIRITEFSQTYEGVYQAVFLLGGETITKTILEIRDPGLKIDEESKTETTVAVDITTEPQATTVAADATTAAAVTTAAT